MRLLLVMAAILPLQAHAQNAPRPVAQPSTRAAPTMTLESAERLLVERNLAVLAARRGIDVARAQRIVASSMPPMQFAVGNTPLEFNEARGGGLRARGLGPANNIQTTLTVIVETGGKRSLRTRLADEHIGIAEALVLDAMRTQIYALRQNFIAALAARANLDVALANRASLDRTEALLRRRLRDGAIAEGDLLRFQASRVQFEQDITSNAHAYAAAVAAVAVALAADAADTTARPRIPQLAAMPFEVQGRFTLAPDPGLTREELAEAVQNRPDVVAALRLASAAGAQVALAEAARWRDVTVSAGYARTRLPQNLPDLAGNPAFANNQLTIQFGIPLFTRRIVEGGIGVATGQAAAADARARAALLQARADFAMAWSQMEQSRTLLRLYTGGALSRAEAAYRSAEQAYLAGGASLLEVLDALRTLNQTRLAANQARGAYLTALANLEQATGVSGIAPRL